MTNAVALIMAGGRDTRLGVLSQKRVKPAVPVAGKYRLIDFTLSNCVNSGIYNIGIPTQYRPHSLNDHIRTGQPWDLDREFSGGVTLLPPCQRDGTSMDWYRGTADAVYQNLEFILRHRTDTVLILSGDHVYKMDYNPLLRYHQEHQADVTICVTDVPSKTASRFGIVVANDGGRVDLFLEKPSRPFNTLASMGVYVFRTEVLVRRLSQEASLPYSTHDFGKDVLPRMLELGDRFYAYRFGDYWVDAGTVQAYWEANMDLLQPDPPLNLFDPRWRIFTRSEERPPAYISPGAAVSNSFITDGCIIEGQVESSVLSPGVRVRVGAVVRNSVIFSDCDIGSGAVVDRAILDKNVTVGEGAVIGCDLDGVPTHGSYDGDNNRLTLVGKNTHLPAGLRVCRGCVIDSDLTEDDFAADLISSNRRANLQPREDPRSSSSIHPLLQEGVPAIPLAIRPAGEG